MRTTLTIDDDVLLAVKERAARESRTVGAVLSDLARKALTNQYATPVASQDDAVKHTFDHVYSHNAEQFRTPPASRRSDLQCVDRSAS